MPDRICEVCSERFWQGQGRPSRRCPRHRGGRYGPAHRQLRAETVAAAYGRPCARCGEVLQPGEPIELDHADDGSGVYIGYSHRSCNASAGASRGNKLRAAAYRRAMGLPPPAASLPKVDPPQQQPRRSRNW